MTYLPCKSVLTEAILIIFDNNKNLTLTTKEIDSLVAEYLSIPDELVDCIPLNKERWEMNFEKHRTSCDCECLPYRKDTSPAYA